MREKLTAPLLKRTYKPIIAYKSQEKRKKPKKNINRQDPKPRLIFKTSNNGNFQKIALSLKFASKTNDDNTQASLR